MNEWAVGTDAPWWQGAISDIIGIFGDVYRPPGTVTTGPNGQVIRQNPGYPVTPGTGVYYPGGPGYGGGGGGNVPVTGQAPGNTGTLLIVGLGVVAAVALMGGRK